MNLKTLPSDTAHAETFAKKADFEAALNHVFGAPKKKVADPKVSNHDNGATGAA